ncbi:unnamed protein product [Euphydryas editha]|uniref:Transposable element P transposase-like RNase H domain-containing protein n=1 Tax=Euphydryas editha TaxID=104508 RepID=A0AAU9TN79_EUPED|nr:unnamed protein product [Euphydryas editha]
MFLKCILSYNERKDYVTGFVTNGKETRPDFADHAQVFMLRELIKNYKQPIAYTFSQAATKGPELAAQLKAVIGKLQEAGLIVVATVCDQDESKKRAKWSHLIDLHNENPGYRGIRLVPKLTDYHCIPAKIPKMKVKYATQVFSQTVATNMGFLADKGILPPECKETADILLFFDRLFDSVNGSFGKRKKYGKPLLGPATPKSVHNQE